MEYYVVQMSTAKELPPVNTPNFPWVEHTNRMNEGVIREHRYAR